MTTSATEKTLALLTAWKWYYWPVERFNAFSGRRTDLFGIIDYLVITEFSTIGVQSCGQNFSEHIRKLTTDEKDNTIAWLSCPGRRLVVIAWRKVRLARGKKLMVFRPRIAWLYLAAGRLVVDEKKTDHLGYQGRPK